MSDHPLVHFEPAEDWRPGRHWGLYAFGAVVLSLVALYALIALKDAFVIEVGTAKLAVLHHKTGKRLTNEQVLAPAETYQGVQLQVLTEGRYYRNPYHWDWEVFDQTVIPEGHVGVKIRMYGTDLVAGKTVATAEGQKGIVAQPLKPGRYPINPYAYRVEIHPAVTVPSGFKGVRTLLTGTEPDDPNAIVVQRDERGVQPSDAAYDPGTYYLNPYIERVSLIDCREQRFSMTETDKDPKKLDFLSADGFAIELGGNIVFRINPQRVADVFVIYNDEEVNGDDVKEEIISKIIMPDVRSFCRIHGSSHTGGEFINGSTREQFQRELHKALVETCGKQGIEILDTLITSITPPQAIAMPVRQREQAKQRLAQYRQEKLQQVAEAGKATQTARVKQRQELVKAEQAVVEQVTAAEQDQAVQITQGEQRYWVAKNTLEAARDQARAIRVKGQADAQVIRFQNQAAISGILTQVDAFDGDGYLLTQNLLYSRLAPAITSIMSNTDGPLMDILRQIQRPPARDARARHPGSRRPRVFAPEPAPNQEVRHP